MDRCLCGCDERSRPGSADSAPADDAFAQAAETHERLNAPIWTARTRLEWGRCLTGRDPGRALVQLTLANPIATAHRLGTSSRKRTH
jgi:hypothetical protein